MTIARARFGIPARVKTDPILNNYLTQTTENNARSVVRRVEAEMQFIFIFPTVVQLEKTRVVFKSLINVQTTLTDPEKSSVSDEMLWPVE